jgi:hypothetical protein
MQKGRVWSKTEPLLDLSKKPPSVVVTLPVLRESLSLRRGQAEIGSAGPGTAFVWRGFTASAHRSSRASCSAD